MRPPARLFAALRGSARVSALCLTLIAGAEASGTRYPIGEFLVPDLHDKAHQDTFENLYRSFSEVMGAPPQFIENSVYYAVPLDRWIENAGSQAASSAHTPEARKMIPVVGLPLASTAAGSPAPDQQFRGFAAGRYDRIVRGVVSAYARQGYRQLFIRLGWEMNIPGTPYYAGDTAQSQADWVSAYRHVYTVLHREAAARHVNLRVIWNPGTTPYTQASATSALYPGDTFVDIIGADVYADIWPYQDTKDPATWHDWATGGEDNSIEQFIANPLNRIHFWNAPAASGRSDGAGDGHSLSLSQLIVFTKQHRKPFAILETGAGNADEGHDVRDESVFPQWLACQLTAAQAEGVKIEFVIFYNRNEGGSYRFTNASDRKPQEAAAWARYFGAVRSKPGDVDAQQRHC